MEAMASWISVLKESNLQILEAAVMFKVPTTLVEYQPKVTGTAPTICMRWQLFSMSKYAEKYIKYIIWKLTL